MSHLKKNISPIGPPGFQPNFKNKVKKVKPGLDLKSLKIKPRSYWQYFTVDLNFFKFFAYYGKIFPNRRLLLFYFLNNFHKFWWLWTYFYLVVSILSDINKITKILFDFHFCNFWHLRNWQNVFKRTNRGFPLHLMCSFRIWRNKCFMIDCP